MQQQIYEPKTNISKPPPHFHERMLYHTTARNVGLYTSLSLAALGAARALLSNGREMVAAALAARAALFLALAMELNSALLWPSTQEEADAQTSKILPYAIAMAHILMCIAILIAMMRGIYTVYYDKNTTWRTVAHIK
jgi:hypothetical protein